MCQNKTDTAGTHPSATHCRFTNIRPNNARYSCSTRQNASKISCRPNMREGIDASKKSLKLEMWIIYSPYSRATLKCSTISTKQRSTYQQNCCVLGRQHTSQASENEPGSLCGPPRQADRPDGARRSCSQRPAIRTW